MKDFSSFTLDVGRWDVGVGGSIFGCSSGLGARMGGFFGWFDARKIRS